MIMIDYLYLVVPALTLVRLLAFAAEMSCE